MNGSVYIDASFKPDEGRGAVVSIGRIKVGHNDAIRPQDLGLRTIRSFHAMPWIGNSMRDVAGGSIHISMSGSIGSLGVLDTSGSPGTISGGYVRVTALGIRMRGKVAGGYPGTIYIGTINNGSLRATYFAVGT